MATSPKLVPVTRLPQVPSTTTNAQLETRTASKSSADFAFLFQKPALGGNWQLISAAYARSAGPVATADRINIRGYGRQRRHINQAASGFSGGTITASTCTLTSSWMSTVRPGVS